MIEKIDNGMWAIKRYIMNKHGCDQADRDMAPLEWYVNTGRANARFLTLLIEAKPFMVARRLHKMSGGNYDEIIQVVKNYIGWEEY